MSDTSNCLSKCSVWRFIYLFLWLTGPITLLVWFPNPLTAANTAPPISNSDIFSQYLWLLFIWFFIVLVLYAWLGDGSKTYKDHVQPYRSIWTTFAWVVLVMILTNYTEKQLSLWVNLSYTLLVLFPWILLLLFLFRRRMYLATQIYDDLCQLDSKGGLLRKAVCVQDPQLTLPFLPCEDIKEKQHIVNLLAEKAFGNFEYVLNLLCLSFLTAIGWYYILYPQSIPFILFKPDNNIVQFSDHIFRNLSNPLTLGFVGAYFFSLQFLVRRYFANDLYPSAFLQVTQRLLLVFILSLVLGIIYSSMSGQDLSNNITLFTLLAFMTGLFPMWTLRFIISFTLYLLKIFFPNKEVDYPEGIIDVPLTKLDGINIWTEERLFQRSIDNVQSLATAEIQRLVLGTPFPTIQIVDWIDQAILYNHAGHHGEWFNKLRAVGIRTASDLLDAATPDYVMLSNLSQEDFKPDKNCLRTMAQALAIKGNDIEEEQWIALLYIICEAVWPDPNIQYVLNFYEQMRQELNISYENTTQQPPQNGTGGEGHSSQSIGKQVAGIIAHLFIWI